jgi:hypothetical protein
LNGFGFCFLAFFFLTPFSFSLFQNGFLIFSSSFQIQTLCCRRNKESRRTRTESLASESQFQLSQSPFELRSVVEAPIGFSIAFSLFFSSLLIFVFICFLALVSQILRAQLEGSLGLDVVNVIFSYVGMLTLLLSSRSSCSSLLFLPSHFLSATS